MSRDNSSFILRKEVLMVTNWVYWRRDSGASKQIFVTIKSPIDAMKFSNTIQLSPF